MKHITISEYGQFIGMTSERLTIKEEGVLIGEYPLNRIKTITVTKKGVGVSSNLMLQCAIRGIKLFVIDAVTQNMACVNGGQLHAVSTVRRKQFKFMDTVEAAELARLLIVGKLKNSRSLLNYFSKYLKRQRPFQAEYCIEAAHKIKQQIDKLEQLNIAGYDDWRSVILGHEGASAAIYWHALKKAQLLPDSFHNREGRGANDPVNSALNYGYSILSTYVWHCLLNAGLEIYQGVLHTQRAGKPSLVLDVMENYRAFVVDRNVIKIAKPLRRVDNLTPKIKRQLIAGIHKTFSTQYLYRGKKVKLETILQRQIYRLSGTFTGEKSFKPYVFKW